MIVIKKFVDQTLLNFYLVLCIYIYMYIRAYVANLSDFKLSPEHNKFLQLGLSFGPTPKFADPVKICHDNEQFCRRLHEYFLSNGDANKQPVHNNRCKTRWTPPNGRNTFIDSFVNYTRDQYTISFLTHHITLSPIFLSNNKEPLENYLATQSL